MRKALLQGLGFALVLTTTAACVDDASAPTAAAPPEAPRAALAVDDGDWGESLVAAEWAAFQADPSTRPGRNVIEAGLASLLETAAATARLEVIVSFDPVATSGAAVASRLHALGAGTVGFRHLPMVYALATPAAVREIAALPGVESVYPNRQLRYELYESTRSIKADAVWTFNGTTGYTGKGVGVAILDSGVDGLYHPGLAFPAKTVQNVKFAGSIKDLVTFGDGAPAQPAASLFVENVATSETTSGHGTHVAGIAGGDGGGSSAGIYRGVAPGSNLVGIGSGDALFVFWILAGFDWLLDNRAQYNIKVVNNSWGTEGAFDPNDPINVGTRAIYDAGVTVVFAAGNSGPGANTLNPYSVAPWVISVAAACKLGVQDPSNSASRCVDPAGRDPVLANFSSRGVPGSAIYHPDVSAPGVRIVSGALAVRPDRRLDCRLVGRAVLQRLRPAPAVLDVPERHVHGRAARGRRRGAHAGGGGRPPHARPGARHPQEVLGPAAGLRGVGGRQRLRRRLRRREEGAPLTP
jgi:serine protease AprX